MAHLSPVLLDHALMALSGVATLYICPKDCTSGAEAQAAALGAATVSISNPESRQGKRFVTVSAVREAPVSGRGTAVCYCLCKGDWMVICNPLQESMKVIPGNVFSLPSFELWFPMNAGMEA